MKRYEFHSHLPPEAFLNDLDEWAPIVGVTCKIKGKNNGVKLWSKHTTLGRGKGMPIILFRGCVLPSGDGCIFRGYYRLAMSSLASNAIVIAWGGLLLGWIGVLFFTLFFLFFYCLDWWDNASERRRVIRILQERYPC